MRTTWFSHHFLISTSPYRFFIRPIPILASISAVNCDGIARNDLNEWKCATELTSTRTHCTSPQMAANPTIITANLLSIFKKTMFILCTQANSISISSILFYKKRKTQANSRSFAIAFEWFKVWKQTEFAYKKENWFRYEPDWFGNYKFPIQNTNTHMRWPPKKKTKQRIPLSLRSNVDCQSGNLNATVQLMGVQTDPTDL